MLVVLQLDNYEDMHMDVNQFVYLVQFLLALLNKPLGFLQSIYEVINILMGVFHFSHYFLQPFHSLFIAEFFFHIRYLVG